MLLDSQTAEYCSIIPLCLIRHVVRQCTLGTVQASLALVEWLVIEVLVVHLGFTIRFEMHPVHDVVRLDFSHEVWRELLITGKIPLEMEAHELDKR